MIVNEDILEVEFTSFVNFILKNPGDKFESFDTSKYLIDEENYKYKVYDEARNNLANKYWKPEDIGTGKIQQRVSSSIESKVTYNGKIVNNNLVNWRLQDMFSKKGNSEKLERTLFNFYKSKIKDSEAFEQFKNEGLPYQFIAYLFFIKDRQKFLPISQKRFDTIFIQIGLSEFKTSHNVSWENYSEFCNIIKQVQNFLKTKDKKATLLDAHSFLWILGNQMQPPEAPVAKNTASTDALTDIANATSIIDALTEKDRDVYTKARIGQGKFRKKLLEHWKACSITGCKNLDVLIASHIKPWRDCTYEEAIDMTNGLLLIPNLDSLFDKGFISFDTDGVILLSPQLSSTDTEQLGVNKSMHLNHIYPQHQSFLEFHRTNIFRKT